MTPFFLHRIGFDVRAPWSEEWSLTWDVERRSTFLLNESIERPLSVDRNVWPALCALEPPTGSNAYPLWADRNLMLRRLSECCAGWEFDADEIVVEVLDEDRAREFQGWESTSDSRATALGSVEILGYDVADAALTSALSNCGFDPLQKPVLQRDFAALLNNHGLFADASAALRFRAIAEERVTAHAPFFVYRIDRVCASDQWGQSH